MGELVQRPMFPPEEWDKLVADHAPPNALLVAVDGERVVGYTALRMAEGEMFLLFVHPDYSGRGIGRRLLEAGHDLLREAGHDEVFLFTEERNQRARAVYEAAGYRPDGTVRESDFEGQPQRELRMVKQL